MIKQPTFIDLFAGAGGLSEGFIRAGYKPIAHVESNKAACFTLKTRAAYHWLRETNNLGIYNKYLEGKTTRDELYSFLPKELLRSIINAKIGIDNELIFQIIDGILPEKDNIDLIIGGPPCQAYSYLGRAALKNIEEDERTKLYIHYGRFLKKYKPKAFVFENVPGIITAGKGKFFNNLKKYFRKIGYTIDYKLLNANNYGVIQNRKRIIIIGWIKSCNFNYPIIHFEENSYNRKDIFEDLPKIKPNTNNRIVNYSRKINEYLKNNELRNGLSFVTQHVTRPQNEKDLKIYKLAIKQLEKGIRIKNDQIPDDIRTQKNITDFLDRFKVVDIAPHAMIAHIAKDGHHYIHPDIKQLRSISVREAARIQSFPDDYFFEGIKENHYRSAAFCQIGNAVPPLFAFKIAKAIKKQMHK